MINCETKYGMFAVKFVWAICVVLLPACYEGSVDSVVGEVEEASGSSSVNIGAESVPGTRMEPTVAIIAPAQGDSFIGGTAILIEVGAADSDGTITKVDFYDNGTLLGSDTTEPYSLQWSGSTGGHDIYAVAFDDDNISSMSDAHTITIAPGHTAALQQSAPVVELISPAKNSSVVEGGGVVMEATASDSDGTIGRVDFYSNGILLGSDKSAPYTFTWSASPGSYDLYAVAVDDDKQSTTSGISNLTITEAEKDSLVTYPEANDVKALFKSSRFAVYLTQNGSTTKSFVYEGLNSANPGWSGTLDYMQTANHWTNFSLEGSVFIQAQRLDGENIETCIVRPLSLGIQTKIVANKCNFKLPQPAKISVEIDEETEVTRHINEIGTITKHVVKHPLFIFADPLEIDPPEASDPDVIYFAPGIHEIGKKFAIPNNTQVYIAGGAYVIGNMVTEEKNPSNISIRGRGILSGYGLTETSAEHASWGNHAIDFSKGSKGEGLLIEGITITDPLRSCIVSYSSVDIQNVKLFSWNHRNDGIVAGNNSLIEDNFIKVMDDNLKLYYSDQTIRRNVIWQQTSGAVFKFAWNLNGTAQNNHVSDIDIIHSDVFTDYPAGELDRPDMQSTSAIFSAMGFRSGAAFQNSSFEDIRIEEEHLLRLMSLRMVTTHVMPSGASTVWGDPDLNADKSIYNLTFNNLSLSGVPYKQSTLYGNSGGSIRKITFSNLLVNGSLVSNKAQFVSQMDGIGLLTDGNVSNVVIQK